MIRSNRESGFGRYDIMLIPRPQREGSLPAMVLEFSFIMKRFIITDLHLKERSTHRRITSLE